MSTKIADAVGDEHGNANGGAGGSGIVIIRNRRA